MFRSIDAVEPQRAGRCFPVQIGFYHFAGPVLIFDPQVEAESRTVAPRCVVEIPYCPGLVVVPSVSEQDPGGIASFLQTVRNIICDIKYPPVESGIHRIQSVIPYLLSVDIQFVQATYGDIRPGGPDRLGYSEFFPEIRSGPVFPIMSVADPASLPVFHGHHSGFEKGHIGLDGRLVFVP